MISVAGTPVLVDCRDAFALTVAEMAAADERVVVVCSDSVGSSKLAGFKQRFPDRLINVGIAEQTLVGVAAGLANGGLRPIISAASSFITARALEQIKVDLAYTNARVMVCGMSPGVAYGPLGPTHHSLEDVAWLRAIDNMVVVVPADANETGQALWAALGYEGPVFVRVSRMRVPQIYDNGYQFRLGQAYRLAEGEDASIIANGTLVARALEAADILREMRVNCRVISMPTVSPLDVEEVVRAAKETGAIVTIEEHSVRGGLGGAVAETVVEHHPVPVRVMGFPGFAPTGSAEFLLEHFHLTAGGIVDAVLGLLKRKAE